MSFFHSSRRNASLRRPAKSWLVAAVVVFVAVAFLSVPRTARGSSSPYRVVHSDTQEIVSSQIVARDTSSESAAVVVTQKEKTFLPATVELHVGQTLEIVNDDTTLHNAYCSAGEFKYNSGPQQPGSKSKLTFAAAGSYEVRCAIHPKMRLAVTVTP